MDGAYRGDNYSFLTARFLKKNKINTTFGITYLFLLFYRFSNRNIEMKKVAALFLLLIMMLSAVQPVLAMHFCGKELYSFSLVQTANLHSCCDNVEQTEKHSHKTEKLSIGGRHLSCILGEAHVTCCDTQLLTLNTDDYQHKKEQPVSRISSFSHEGAAPLLISLFKLSETETNTFPSLQNFPPKGLFLQDVSLRTYLCIYRI